MFSRNCSHHPFQADKYTGHMVRDTLVRGIDDSDIQQNVLRQNDQDLTLKNTINIIVVKEAGKRSRATLRNTSGATQASYNQAIKNQNLNKCWNIWKNAVVMAAMHRIAKCKACERNGSKCDKRTTSQIHRDRWKHNEWCGWSQHRFSKNVQHFGSLHGQLS